MQSNLSRRRSTSSFHSLHVPLADVRFAKSARCTKHKMASSRSRLTIWIPCFGSEACILFGARTTAALMVGLEAELEASSTHNVDCWSAEGKEVGSSACAEAVVRNVSVRRSGGLNERGRSESGAREQQQKKRTRARRAVTRRTPRAHTNSYFH